MLIINSDQTLIYYKKRKQACVELWRCVSWRERNQRFEGTFHSFVWITAFAPHRHVDAPIRGQAKATLAYYALWQAIQRLVKHIPSTDSLVSASSHTEGLWGPCESSSEWGRVLLARASGSPEARQPGQVGRGWTVSTETLHLLLPPSTKLHRVWRCCVVLICTP